MEQYKVINGTSYKVETLQQVIDILEHSRQYNERIRVFYGDNKTGRDWMEELDTIGRVGRSTGTSKIPLLIKTKNSYGGGALLDANIIKITKGKKVIYQHKDYHLPTLEITEPTEGLKELGYKASVMANGDNIANFKSHISAHNYIEFLKGNRNKY